MSIYCQLNSLLIESGLTEAEVAVYLELLKNPAHTAWEIVRRTGLAKSVVYRACDRLKQLKMLKKEEGGLHALSLKALVAELQKEERHLRKTAIRIKEIAPFLRAAREPVESFETLHTLDQIRDAYLFMAEQPYEVNLDFGDFESFIPLIGGLDTGNQFRNSRIKHATHHAICTTFGPYSAYYATRESAKHFKNKIDRLNLDFKNQFIIFSDKNDHVLYNHCEDPENPYSVLVKSKAIADAERSRFAALSQKFGNG